MSTKEIEIEELQHSFTGIVKKAYELGTSDKSVTLQTIMEELKTELVKLKG